MKLRSILLGVAVAAAIQTNAQTWVLDTIKTETGYSKNVYYSLANGTAAKVDANNWHIGFSVNTWSASIITNSADKGVKLYEISNDPADFGNDMKADLLAAMTATPNTYSFYNSNLTWEIGAFNQNSGSFPNYGWGDYDMSSHWINGKILFGLITGTDTFQIFIESKEYTPPSVKSVYNVKIANIDGTNQRTKVINMGVAPYTGKYFGYYDIVNDIVLDREPARTDWDFVFSNYNDEDVVAPGIGAYKVFGIINNEGLKVAKVDTAETEFDNIASQYATYNYDTVNNSIGRAWKVSGMSGTFVEDSLCYFVETANGDVWQLVFTAHNSGSASADPGLVALKKRKVSTVNAVRNVNSDVALFQVFPNPAVNDVTVLIEAKQKVDNAQLMITDMTGKIVFRGNANVNSGLNAIAVSTANLSSGNYIVTVTNGAWKASQKLAVQH